MNSNDLISVVDACSLLDISATTLRTYRKKYEISSVRIRKQIKFSKAEILYKIYTMLNPPSELIGLSIYTTAKFSDLKIDDSTYDLRIVDYPDGHGAISLLCHIVSEVNKGKYIHLLVGTSKQNLFLIRMGFFRQLIRWFGTQVFWDEDVVQNIDMYKDDLIKLPITKLGIVGSHKTIVDDMVVSLDRQGYSDEICSYIGWAIGELADNSATHAKIHPSYVYLEQYGEDRRYLQFTIGDSGIGIPASLKGNVTHSNLSDQEALLNAFKPYISGRPDEEERGKGLTDVLMIAMECGSSLRVESNDIGYSFDFNKGVDNFRVVEPLYSDTGTIISIMFHDGNFSSVRRSDVATYIDECTEKM